MAIGKIGKDIKETADRVYNQLGAGHQEVIYREAMSFELQNQGYTVKTEMPVTIKYRIANENKKSKEKEIIIGVGRVDLYVEKDNEKAIVELKAVAPFPRNGGKINPGGIKACFQLHKYLEALSKEKGFIINFPFPPVGKPEIVESL